MNRQFPEARAFGATLLYWPDAVKTASKSSNRKTPTSSEANAIDSAQMDKHRYDDALVELACLNELERQSNQIV